MRSSVALAVLDELGERRRQARRSLLVGKLEQDLHLPRPRHPRQRPADVVDRVEAGRRLVGLAVGERDPADAVDPERPLRRPAVVVRGEVPAAAVHDQAVRAHAPVGSLSGVRPVREANATASPDRVREPEHRVASHGDALERPPREPERRLERLDLAAQQRRQHPVDLRERCLRGVALAVEPEPPGRQQPERDGDRLVVAQHQRRQPVARPDAVAAADAALALHGDPELLERRDVAADGARADAEALGDLPSGGEGSCLEQLEQGEQP